MIGFLALLAGGLLVAAVLVSATPFALDGFGRLQPSPGGGSLVDPVSFTIGFAAGLTAVWMYHVPWGSFPRRAIAALLGWRQNFVLMSLAAACAGVLLFY